MQEPWRVKGDGQRKRRKKSDIGKCPGGDWIWRRERSEVGATRSGPRGGELSRDRGLGLSESAHCEELGAAIRALRGGVPAARRGARPDRGPERQYRTLPAAGGPCRRLGPG
ncbi:hypothetical protein NDU88_002991 [Pleurodeles waltl]|uniref:Uncharacterized protein n=1 Tax=Pleurodeles waltl TaxID=8319 RepID=A0AAV7VCW8_PLEWA|nr:hypothetical protein NDU88_002991 [Pleurodeles waltl]